MESWSVEDYEWNPHALEARPLGTAPPVNAVHPPPGAQRHVPPIHQVCSRTNRASSHGSSAHCRGPLSPRQVSRGGKLSRRCVSLWVPSPQLGWA
jgi:hypothetical protein